VASVYLTRLARPGGERRISSVSQPRCRFAAIVLLAAVSLGLAPSSHGTDVMEMRGSRACFRFRDSRSFPFAVMMWAVRQAAPTDLRRAGAFAGLVAAATVHWPTRCIALTISLPFVAVWYGGTIALCTLAGAILGPRALRVVTEIQPRGTPPCQPVTYRLERRLGRAQVVRHGG